MDSADDTSRGKEALARGDEEDELEEIESGAPGGGAGNNDDEGDDDEVDDTPPPKKDEKKEEPPADDEEEEEEPPAPTAKAADKGGKAKYTDDEVQRLRDEHEAMLARIDEIVANGGMIPRQEAPDDAAGGGDDDDPSQPDLDDVLKGRVSAQLRPFKMKAEDAERLGIPEKQVPHHENYIDMMARHTINEALPVIVKAIAPLVYRINANLTTNLKRVDAFLEEYPELDSPRSRNIVNFAMGLAVTEAREKKVTDEGEILKLARAKYAETLGQANEIAEKLSKKAGTGKVTDARDKKGGKPAGGGTRGTGRRQPAPPDNRSATQKAMEEIRSADESPTVVKPGSPFSHLFNSRS